MKRFLFNAGLVSLVLAGCSGGQNGAVVGNGNPGGGTEAKSVGGLPLHSDADLAIRAFEELTRFRASAFDLLTQMGHPDLKDGCRTLRHYQQDLFMRATYNCNWSQPVNGQALEWSFRGEETFLHGKNSF